FFSLYNCFFFSLYVFFLLFSSFFFFFFFNDTATTEIYTLSLHDALPISFISRPVILIPFAWSIFIILGSPPRVFSGCRLTSRRKPWTPPARRTSSLPLWG